MEACVAVEKEVDKVLSKFNSIKNFGSRTIEDAVKTLEDLKAELQQTTELNAAQTLILNQAVAKIKETIGRLATEHRDLHGTVSKVGKTIDRNFIPDYASTSNEEVFADPERVKALNQVICQHFYRQGFLEIGEQLAKESGLDIDASQKKPFVLLNDILESLRQKNLDPALEWAKTHRNALLEQNSSLEFKLHRLQFLRMISEGPNRQAEALLYARTHFPPFVHKHETDVQKLMGVMLYLPYDVQNSPYKKLFYPNVWTEICDVFVRDACTLLGFSMESPLSVCVNAGCIALPALLNIKQVMKQRQVAGMWQAKDELPIEIDIGREYRYHSIFSCPILRQQSSDLNPPMRLVCGHVISRDALHKLSSGNKLKCPYCPLEQSPNDAQQLHF